MRSTFTHIATLAAYTVDAGDVDGDTDLDLVIGYHDIDRVLVHYNADFNSMNFTRETPFELIPATGDFSNEPLSVDLVDLDGDGFLDIYDTIRYEHSSGWYRNLGNGTFEQRVVLFYYPPNGNHHPFGSAVADLSGDGLQDPIYSSASSGFVAWRENLGSGSFGPVQVISATASNGARQVAPGDANGDGTIDLAVSAYDSNNVDLYLNNNFGASWTRVLLQSSLRTHAIIMADVDADGDNEVVVTNYNSGSVNIFWNDGAGTFSSAPFVYTISSGASEGISVGDTDGDGYLEIFVAAGTRVFHVFPLVGIPSMTTIAALEGTPTSSYSSPLVVDIDADGDKDVLALVNNALVVSVQTLGIFAPPLTIDASLPGLPFFFTAGDVDGDGDVDIIGGTQSGSLYLYQKYGLSPSQFQSRALLTKSGFSSLSLGSLQLLDLDHTGNPELLIRHGSNTLYLCSLQGDTVSLLFSRSISSSSSSVAGAKLDGDRWLDVVYRDPSGVRAFLGTPSGLASSSVSIVPGSYSQFVLGEFDGNDLEGSDIALLSGTSTLSLVFFNASLDTFSAVPLVVEHTLPPGFAITDLAAGDGTGDGLDDLAVTSGALGGAFVLWNRLYTSTVSFRVKTSIADADTVVSSLLFTPLGSDDHMADVVRIHPTSTSPSAASWISTKARFAAPSGALAPSSFGAPPPSPVVATRTRTPLCVANTRSVECLMEEIAATSPLCPLQQLVIPAGEYTGCRFDSHFVLPRSAHLTVESGGDALINCTLPQDPTGPGGALWLIDRPTGSQDTVSVDLTGISITRMGIGQSDILGAPGIRVSGESTSFTLRNASVTHGFSGTLSGVVTLVAGTGGCAAAVSGASINGIHTQWAHCVASTNGGALAAQGPGSIISLKNSHVHHNSVSDGGGGGGALYVDFLASASVEHTLFENNEAPSGLGGAILVRPAIPSLFSNVQLRTNSAAVGGGIAVAPPGVNSMATAPSVADAPQALTGFGYGNDAAPQTIKMTDVQMVDNTASATGGGAYVCDGRLELEGPGSVWTGNEAVRTRDHGHAGGDIFVCVSNVAPVPFVPLRSNASRLPFLEMDQGFLESTLGDAHIHSGLVSLAYVDPPEEEMQAGSFLSGSIRGTDGLGQVVVFPSVQLRLRYGEHPSLDVPILGDVFLSSTETELPVGVVRVHDGTNSTSAPWRVAHTLSVVTLSSSGYQVSPLVREVDVTACLPGFGVVSVGTGLECRACPLGSYSAETSLAPCVSPEPCGDNSVRLASEVRNASVVEASAAEPCLCLPGFYTPSGVSDTPCLPCPVGGECAGGTERPRARPGYDVGEGGVFVSCPNPQACAGNGICARGYKGRMCGACAPNYYQLGETCRKCDKTRTVIVVCLLLLGGLVFITGVLTFSLAEGIRYKFAAVVIALNSFQVTALYGRLKLDWGPIADMYFAVVSSLNLNVELTSPECSVSNVDVWVMKWILTLLLPVFVGMGLGIAAGLVWALIKFEVWWFATRTMEQLKSALPRAYFQLFVLLYLPLAAAGFALFGCVKDEAGRWVFTADATRSCYNKAWFSLLPLGLISALVYGVATPLFVVYSLYSRRNLLDPITFVLRYGFLVNRFDTAFWYYEGVLMARKLLVVICMTFFTTNDSKANATVVALAGCGALLAWQRPYASPFHNLLAVIVLSATTIVLHGGTYRDYTLRRGAVLAGLIVNTLAIFIGNAIDLVLIARSEKDLEDDYEMEVVGTASNMFVNDSSDASMTIGDSFVIDSVVSSTGPGGSGGSGKGEMHSASIIDVSAVNTMESL